MEFVEDQQLPQRMLQMVYGRTLLLSLMPQVPYFTWMVKRMLSALILWVIQEVLIGTFLQDLTVIFLGEAFKGTCTFFVSLFVSGAKYLRGLTFSG
jgi:hypothetical protein